MNGPRTGDRVRVVLEGTVLQTWRTHFCVGGTNGSNIIAPDDGQVVSVEVLRRLAKVGDVIDTVEQLDALPLGTVVYCNRRCAAERYAGGWYETAEEMGTFSSELLPATVLYLPDGAA